MNDEFHSLWIGKYLGETELLTLHSFAAHGHYIKLWVYDTPKHVPKFVELREIDKHEHRYL